MQNFMHTSVVFVMLIIGVHAHAAEKKLPQFNDYPAASQSTCRQVTVDLNSHPQANEYRTQLRTAAKRRCPEFAGHYIVAEWGCGSPCQQQAFIDVRDGHVMLLPFSTQVGANFQVNSRLFVVNPEPGTLFQRWWWEWNGKKLNLLLEE